MATFQDFMNCMELLNDDFMWYNYKKNPASAQQIAEYENSHGLKFTDEVKEFLQTLGAVILEVEKDVWPRPNEGDILPAWEFGYGMFIYGLSSEENMLKWMTYDEKFSETMAYGDISLGQLFFKRSGNLYRAYINNDGVITIEYDDLGDDRNIFDGDFWDFLISEIDKLDADYKEYVKLHPKK